MTRLFAFFQASRPARVLAVAGLLAASVAHAQSEPGRLAVTDLSIERLESRRATASARGDLDAATKEKIDAVYRSAIAELRRAKQFRAEAEALRKATAAAPGEVIRLERMLDEADRSGTEPEPPGQADRLSLDQISQRVTDARLARDAAQQALDAVDRAIADHDDRPLALRRQREAARASLEQRKSERSAVIAPASPLEDARRAVDAARAEALRAELEWLDREAAYHPALSRILQLKHDLARIELVKKDRALHTWLAFAVTRQQQEVTAARKEAERTSADAGSRPTILQSLAADNADLTARVAETTYRLDWALLELTQLRAEAAGIESRRRTIERIVDAGRLGAEGASMLAERLRSIPNREQLAANRAERAKGLQSVADGNARTRSELAALGDFESAVANAVASIGADYAGRDRAAIEAAIRDQLGKKRALLARLNEQQEALLQVLQEAESAEADLAERIATLRSDVVKLLLWVPLNPLGPDTLANLVGPLAWMFAPANWRMVGDTLVEEVGRRPWQTGLALAAVLALYAIRGRLKTRLGALAPAAVSIEHYRIGHTLQALLLTLLLALPGALLLWTAGFLLEWAPAAPPFALAVGDALVFVASTFLGIYGFSWLFDARGVAVKHFNWPTASMVAIQRALRRFMVVYVPLAFVAVANSVHAPYESRESLGRIAFILAMIAVAALMWHLFRRSSPITAELIPEGARSWTARLRPFWFGLLVLFPVALAVLSAAGFYFAAIAVFQLFKQTLILVLVAVIVYGLVALWVLVQRARLARRQALAEAAGPESVSEAGRAAPRPQVLDIAAIGHKSRQLLNLVTTIILALGLWIIWRNALPIFDVFGNVILWHYTETAGDGEVVGAVTLGSLALAIAIVAVTFVGTRNIGAILDIVLLQRLELEKDATYAIKTISRYLILGVGLVLASNVLHVSWDKLRWLVAALGVGLGFGLQEIVANFVSGLIVLGERPIRIGDVVTVGDVTGTVTRIQARATVVTDWDNKEIMIPNKAFITERVINWTLSSQTTRLFMKVGVAYGTDVEKAQRVMLDAVTSIPDVLEDPSPSVFFVGFGDSSLDFEIRAFVDSFDKRLRTQHAINVAVNRVLAENGIEIPFPQRDLHIRSAEGLAGLSPKSPDPLAGRG